MEDTLSLRCNRGSICARHANNPQPLSSENVRRFFTNVSAEEGRCDIYQNKLGGENGKNGRK